MAKLMPWAIRTMAVLIPMTRVRVSTKGPPELPGFSATTLAAKKATSNSGGARSLRVAVCRSMLDPGEEVIRDRDRPRELDIDMLQLLPSAVHFRPKPFVLLLDRFGLPLQPLVLVEHRAD